MNEKPNTTAGGDVARPAGTTGESLLTEAKHAVGHMAEGAKEQVTTRVESQKEKAAEKIGSVAGALRAAGEPLQDIGPLPDLAGAAADKIESIAEYVQSRTVGDLVREAESFARREPAIFLGAAFGLGLLAGRFLKSSPRREIHPEIQDDMFEEDFAFGGGGVGRFEASQPRTPGYGASTYGSTSYGSSTPSTQSSSMGGSTAYGAGGSIPGRTGTTAPGVGSSGFGGYGGSTATNATTPYDTAGSSVSAKPSTDVTSKTDFSKSTSELSGNAWSRNEGTTTKPMGTLGEPSATSSTGPKSSNGSSGNGGAPRSTGRP